MESFSSNFNLLDVVQLPELIDHLGTGQLHALPLPVESVEAARSSVR